MLNLEKDLCRYYNFEFSAQVHRNIKEQINKSPGLLKTIIRFLINIDSLIRIFIRIFRIRSLHYTKFILDYRPPLLFNLYKLLIYILILNNCNEN